MRALAQEFLADEDKQIRMSAMKALLPYVFQEQPKSLEHSGLGGEPIQVTLMEVSGNGQHIEH
jgi:hypothetical protein